MITEKYRKLFTSCFPHESDEFNPLITQSALYCCAQWICHYNDLEEISIENVIRLLAKEAVRNIFAILTKGNEIQFDVTALHRLCCLIHRVKFCDGRAKLFYQYVLTSAVSDSSLFTDSTIPTIHNGPVSCTMIHLSLLYSAEEMGTGAIFNSSPHEVFARHEDVIGYFGVKYDEFERYWIAIHWVGATYMPRKRQKIEQAVKVFRKYHVPVSVLLEQYAQARNFAPEELRKVMNPWEYVNKKLIGSAPECGMSIDEQVFNSAAYQISRESPTDVIRTLYCKDRDDSRIECALIRSEMLRLKAITKQCLIVNPSPVFMEEYNDLWDLEDKGSVGLEKVNVTIAVNDEVIAFLYRQQFPEFDVVLTDRLGQLHTRFDHVTILARDFELSRMWSALTLCKDEAYVTMLLPQTVLTEPDPLFVQSMKQNQIYTDWILEVPSVLTGTEPKKKMLVAARKGSVFAGRSVYIHSAVTNERNDYFTIQKKQIIVPPDWIYRGLTLAKMRKEALSGGTKEIKSRDSLSYDFSSEIKICYQLSRRNGKIERARAYYRNIHRPEIEKSRTKGKRPNDIITERGLRGTSEAQIRKGLEKVALYEEYYDHIVADIKDYYSADLSVLTVKTMWFCCRSILLTKISYDESIAMQLFCGENQVLSYLVSGACGLDNIEEAMNDLYGEDGAGKKEWLQLHLIYQVAVDEGMVDKNPLVSMMHVVRENNRKRIYMLNAALRKSHFTEDEEIRMFRFLCENVSQTGRKGICAPRYVVESKWLAGAFALYTGLPAREICPLLWKDLCCIDDTDEMQIAVTKHLNTSDDVISNVNYGNKEHYRKVAIDPVLGKMLMQRRDFLIRVMGYAEEGLTDLPIMLDTEPSGRGRRKHTRISRSTVRKVNKQLLAVADIQDDIISLLDGDAHFDINLNAQKYDLFAANFRHKAYHICGFTAGELSHHLGNKGDDTFFRHYCDYNNDYLQYAMVRKLNRWTYIYNYVDTEETHSLDAAENDHAYSAGPYQNGRAHAELIIRFPEVYSGAIDLEIDCQHGLDGTVIGIGR